MRSRTDLHAGASDATGPEASAGGVRLALARRVADRYATLPEVLAVAVGGSVGAGRAGDASDVDLYVYASTTPDLGARRDIATERASRSEVDNRFWETGDEWIDTGTGIAVDVMFREPAWIEEALERVLVRHEASVGYTTCLWANVAGSLALHDPTGWYGRLQAAALVPYPDGLRAAIVAKNLPLLRGAMSGYRPQLAKAAARADVVSLNHRAAAFLASVFDILFALNRRPHPGEKRLLELASALCPLRPPALEADVAAFLAATVDGAGVVAAADRLTDGLEALLRAEGLLPPA